MIEHVSVKQNLARLETLLHDLVTQAEIPANEIRQAILYALFPGGKRLRPALVYLCGAIVDAPPESLDYIAAAIELTHCYSLIHDDLPAMDDDDFRRGKPSCHRAFGEATAILAGDAMQAFAIEILLKYLPETLNPSRVIEISHALVQASGPSGMVSGQSLDLSELANPNIQAEQLKQIHQLKTGRLIQACVSMAISAGTPSTEEINALSTFGKQFGLVFQMQDDYLDHYHSDKLGKGRSSDLANEKITFANLLDKSTLYEIIESSYQSIYNTLASLGVKTKPLIHLLDQLHNQIL